MTSGIARLRAWLGEPVDAASSAAFRIALGALLFASTLRFAWKGWIDEFYLAPSFHFGWTGFEWLTPFPRAVLYGQFGLMALCALCLMLGFCYRAAALCLCLAFTCVELFDKTYYLNHYYLVSLLLALCVVLPLHRTASLDARLWPARRSERVPRAVPLLCALQLGFVYFFAGLAKLDGDWLLRAQPLTTWLARYADAPAIGPLLQLPGVAHGLAWAGAIFDLSVAFLLCARRTRLAAYGLLVAFHAATGLLFPIGLFPRLMIALTPVFFAPTWPRALFARLSLCGPAAGSMPAAARPLAALPASALALYVALQLVLPLRHVLHPGAVNWTEEGFRFAWRVMLIEKTGRVELRVHDPRTGERFAVSPREELSARQLAMMATQPDMIAQYARHLARRFEARGRPGVEVYADAFASLNGRRPQRLIDPDANLALPAALLARRGYVVPLSE